MLDLNRPFESVAWLKQAIKTDPDNSAIKTVSQKLQTYQPPADLAGWVACGVEVNEFPSPDVSRLVTSVASSGEPDAKSDGQTIRLADVAKSLGIDFQYDPGNQQNDGSYLLHQTMGGGIGVIDFDHDGWPDVYFSQGGGKAFSQSNLSNRLSRNLDGQSFVDVTTSAGVGDKHYGQGVTAADFNQDGFTDLIVANIGPNVFYQNNGDGSFTQIFVPEWSDKDYWTSQVACADLSGDSLVELVECNYIDDPRSQSIRCTTSEQLCAPSEFSPSINRVLTGNLDSTFSVWKDGAPMHRSASYSLGVVVCDLDDRNGNDVFVANDTLENTLWISQHIKGSDDSGRSFSLVEQARLRGCATGSLGELQGCMGIATGDFDRNGRFDMYVTNYYNEPSNLFLQQDAGLFIDGASLYSARESSVPKVGFGTQSTDLDSDGWLDLVVLNGHAVDRRDKGEPLQMTPQIYLGSRGMIREATTEQQYWKTPTQGRTLARWDFDRDGRMDFLANHLDRPVAVLENDSVGGSWVQIELVGTLSERDANGCKVTVHCGDRSWVSWVTAGDGYFCTNEPVMHVGIDQSSKIDRIEIQWPSGKRQQVGDLSLNRRYLVIEGIDESFQQ